MKTIYRYGLLAWFWRVLIAAGQGIGWFLVVVGFMRAEFWLYVVAIPLIVPGWFFGHVVASQVDLLDHGALVVTTLMGRRRRLTRDDLGKPRTFFYAQADTAQVYAPRVWIPVRSRWPVYLDLLGTIPDRRAFIATFRIDARSVPSKS